MSDLFRSPRGKLGLVAAGGVLLLAATWFLVVAPQRSKASKLSNDVTAAQAQLAQRRVALARPSAKVTVKPGDLYRLTKALPNETDMSGVLIDVDRVARANKLSFTSITPSSQVAGTGYLEQPVGIVVQGRFGNVSNFLGDLRRLVSVRHGRLDARGRIYTVSKVTMNAPDSPTSYPVVKAAVTLNAYSFTQAPSVSTPSPSTTTDTSSSGTVAAGANP
jgi:Tfp pilus assembly protein PilO